MNEKRLKQFELKLKDDSYLSNDVNNLLERAKGLPDPIKAMLINDLREVLSPEGYWYFTQRLLE